MMFPLDLDAVLTLQRLAASCPWGRELAVLCARWAIFLNIPLALVLLSRKKKDARHGVFEALWTTGLALLFVAFIAFVVRRPRPFLEWPSMVMSLIPPPYNTSFPSGHTAAALSIALALYIADRRIGTIAFVIAALTALGRMTAGVHYPTDILGGAAVALVAFFIVRRAHARSNAADIVRAAAAHHHDA